MIKENYNYNKNRVYEIKFECNGTYASQTRCNIKTWLMEHIRSYRFERKDSNFA